MDTGLGMSVLASASFAIWKETYLLVLYAGNNGTQLPLPFSRILIDESRESCCGYPTQQKMGNG